MICFDPEAGAQLVDALRAARPLLLHCGTIWVTAPPAARRSPRTSRARRTANTGPARWRPRPTCLRRARRARVILHPGHIVGPGWPVITPLGNLDGTSGGDPGRRRAAPLPDLGLGVPAPCARRRRRAGVRARAHPAAGDRRELPRRGRAGDDARGLAGAPRRGSAGRRTSSSSSWAESASASAASTRTPPASTSGAASPRASSAPGRARLRALTSLQALEEAVRWLAADGQADVDVLSRAREQHVPLALRSRQRAPRARTRARLVEAAELLQQVAAHARQQVVVARAPARRRSASTSSSPAAGPTPSPAPPRG